MRRSGPGPCSVCKETVTPNLSGICTACGREQNRRLYAAGGRRTPYTTDRAENAQARVRRCREINTEIINAKKAKPCADCGVQYPPHVMGFDHRPGEEKVNDLARMKTYSVQRILAEIAKCDVVCHNCHAERTHSRRIAAQAYAS